MEHPGCFLQEVIKESSNDLVNLVGDRVFKRATVMIVYKGFGFYCGIIQVSFKEVFSSDLPMGCTREGWKGGLLCWNGATTSCTGGFGVKHLQLQTQGSIHPKDCRDPPKRRVFFLGGSSLNDILFF